jgi:hypothetical protein
VNQVTLAMLFSSEFVMPSGPAVFPFFDMWI